MNLLRLVSLQIGNEVSYHELASSLNLSKNTVEKYLDLLSRVFILFKLGGYNKNLRKEISKSSKWYFYDNGIRNALASDFNPLALRNDHGFLWENYIMAERLKFHSLLGNLTRQYFWRTYDHQEIDLVEEDTATLRAYEFKWKQTHQVTPPIAWRNAYPGASYQVIHPLNYMQFLKH